MEAADSGARLSDPSSAQKPQHTYPSFPAPRDPPRFDSMATVTVLHPTSSSSSSTHPAPSSYPTNFPHPTSNSNSPRLSNMISSSEPRRELDTKDSPKRQSLPSISEVISNTKSSYPAPTYQQHNQAPGLPRFDPDRHAQHALPPYARRPDAIPTNYPESSWSSFNPPRTGLPPVGERRPSPPGRIDKAIPHELQRENRSLNGTYAHPSPVPHQPGPVSYQAGPLPPGQLPLPSYPASPRHAHQTIFEPSRGGPSSDPISHDSVTYTDSLTRLGHASRTMFNFAEAYARIAQEQHGQHPIPERLPTEAEVVDMLSNADLIKASITRLREFVQQQSLRSERARESAKSKGPYEEEHQDATMFGSENRTQYGMTEVKKRRGRAAPPGRCHSCNRIDTPEWRRGPDGARTLCNACGLHYAKLERKRQLEARSIRPKPEERN